MDMDTDDKKDDAGDAGANVALCASCDRCRARKTKCDGKRPCGNCAAKYMKKHKITSIDGIDPSEFECVYSPAKRRGPVPGRSGQIRKAAEAFRSTSTGAGPGGGGGGVGVGATVNGANGGMGGMGNGGPNPAADDAFQQALAAGGGAGDAPTTLEELQLRQMMLQNQQSLLGLGGPDPTGSAGGIAAAAGLLDPNAQLQQQLNLFQKIQQQQQQHQQQQQQVQQAQQQQQQAQQQQNRNAGGGVGVVNDDHDDEPAARRMKMDRSGQDSNGSGSATGGGIPKTITEHTHFLDKSDVDGNRLRAFYRLSIDELFRLPLTPTDEDYCQQLNIPGMTPAMIPGAHLAALSAARFAEVALGAVVNNEVSLGMELCNAVVHCLRECVQEPVQPQYMFEVARAYFLLGVFRACRGDMERYFKYRRVSMTYLSKFDANSDQSAILLLAAISFLDSWAYMMYNADDKKIPHVDDTIPPVETTIGNSPVEQLLAKNAKLAPCRIAADPKNKNWIQGAPPVYLNNEAPLPARALDALACAVRTCCDQANNRFNAIAKESNSDGMNPDEEIPLTSIKTPTTIAVASNENELCSRNLVLSAFTLLQQYEASSSHSWHKNQGQHLIISAMDAFLENNDEDGSMGFTDSQIQSLLSVCNNAIENPYLLHHAGPTYHMVTNACVLLCHLLNGMYAMKESNGGTLGEMESAMFEEVLDTMIATRKLLTIHRRKLPVKLRCHGIPRPSSMELSVKGGGGDSNDNDDNDSENKNAFIDLGETVLCACRGCQGFVLMACSPCVAAERAMSANARLEVEAAREAEAVGSGELDRELDDLGSEFNLDDDALLGMISKLISS